MPDKEIKEIDADKTNQDKISHNKSLFETSEDPLDTVVIDRDKEDADVEHFQKTGDLQVLEDVYKQRIPTLRFWANKHYYPGLTFSVEDLFEDLSVVFVKAAEKYIRSRGAFNTCLYTFLDNRLKNIKNSRHAKKRLPDEYVGPAIGMILSLDYSYNATDGSEVTLKDVIPSSDSQDNDYILNDTYFDETLNVLSKDNEQFKEFLKKIGEGNSLVALMKEYKTRQGTLKITQEQASRFGNRKCTKLVSDLIKEHVNDDFKLLGYEIEGTNRLKYEVELNKTKETDKFMKSLREIRKNKDFYKRKLEYIS